MGSLFLAVLTSVVLFHLSPAHFGPLATAVLAGVGVWLLLWPAWQLHGSARKTDAMRLFNLASYYPLALFAIVTLRLLA